RAHVRGWGFLRTPDDGRDAGAGGAAARPGAEARDRWLATLEPADAALAARGDCGPSGDGVAAAAPRKRTVTAAHRLRVGRFARAAHAARANPHVFRDAAAGSSALGARANALARNHRPGGPSPHAPRREPAALLAFGTAGHTALPRPDGARPARAPDGRSVHSARRDARSHSRDGAPRRARRSRRCGRTPPDASQLARQRGEVRAAGPEPHGGATRKRGREAGAHLGG